MSPSIAVITRLLRQASRPAAAFLAFALAVLFAQTGGHAQAVDALSYSRGILITGNYVLGGVDLKEDVNPVGQDGFATGTVSINGVPSEADIIAAYLYWETITLTADPSQARARFRGQDIPLDDVVSVKRSSQDLTGNFATCWSSGSPLTMHKFRADVLRFLPIRSDKDNTPTIKRVVNDADLTAHGLSPHTVSLPTRNGNQVPESGGASLVIVYRDPSEPLRKIVFYDGIRIQESLTDTLTQTLRGFYQSSATKSAKVTYLIAGGQPNNNERIFFNDGVDTQISEANPILGATSSERSWSGLTYNVSALMNPGNNAGGGFGETATTRIDHSGGGGYDCLALGAVVFSTAVADTDPNQDGGPLGDGIPDGLEDAAGGLNLPDGTPLPNLNAMGASSAHRDLFVEINAMWATPGTSYGSPAAPYDSTHNTVTDANGHTHMPTPQVLKMVGDAYAAHGITPHFDVGDITAYHGLGVVQHEEWVDDYTSTEADAYLVPSQLARGGEIIEEVACDPTEPSCQFPAYPGTVPWKLGLQFHRDAPVRDDGGELTLQQATDPSDPLYFDWNAHSHRRRFDRNRLGVFHYLLYAHTRGKRKSYFPCLVNGQPAPYDQGSGNSCSVNNPDYNIPSSASGIADVPGGNALVTLGKWDEFVGTPFVRASTTFHELGHNLDLWHGGQPVTWGNKALNTATFVEPTCKPNVLSSMSYSFQIFGLFDNDDEIHIDYSGTQHGNFTEATAPGDASLFPLAGYRPAWYAPAGSSLATTLGVAPATRFCSGVKFDPNAPPAPMARVYTETSADLIDFNGDLIVDSADALQDVNFDGSLSASFNGFNDWASLRLNQISAGPRVRLFGGGLNSIGGGMNSIGDGLDSFGGSGLNSIGDGLNSIGDGLNSIGDGLNSIGDGLHSIGDGLNSIGDGLNSIGDGLNSIGGGLNSIGGGAEQELDFDIARGLGRSAPYSLKACIVGGPACTNAPPFTLQYHGREVRWQAPSFGDVFQYLVSRKRGNAASSFPYVSPTPSSTSSTPIYVDTEQLPDGLQFTYRVRAEFADETPHVFSGFSVKPVTITAVNDAPIANADGYTTKKNGVLNVAAPGVLANDTDVDSPASFLRAVVVTGPANGTLVLNANGSFSYNPKNGFTGTDSFTYGADNGFWSGDPTVPLSGFSSTVTVVITVTAK